MDTVCSRCGKPWGTLVDCLTQEEEEWLLTGEGCPDCIDTPDSIELEKDDSLHGNDQYGNSWS